MDAWRDYNWIRAGISTAALTYIVTLILGLNGPILIAPFTYKTSSAVLPLHAVCEDVPLGSGLATPEFKGKSTATPLSCVSDSAHVLLMCSDFNSESTVRQTVLQLLSRTKLIVLSVCEHKVHVCKGEASLQHHGDFLLAACSEPRVYALVGSLPFL